MPQAVRFETGFGRRLRHERERRKISLSTIAASTKISAALLDGLEREDLSRWPSGIFRRSFVRAYAQAIGLDPEAVVAEFLERFPVPVEHPGPSNAAPPGDERLPPAEREGRAVDAFGSRSAKPFGSRSAKAVALREAIGRKGPVVRLQVVEAVRAFRSGMVLSDTKRRWAAVAWDAGVLVAVALVLFIVVNSFWKPFGVLTLTYYIGGILVLGNTPGVCLFAAGEDG